jgi:hypothetical protein
MQCFSPTVGQVISGGFSNLSYSFTSCAANTRILFRLDEQKSVPSKGECYPSEPDVHQPVCPLAILATHYCG